MFISIVIGLCGNNKTNPFSLEELTHRIKEKEINENILCKCKSIWFKAAVLHKALKYPGNHFSTLGLNNFPTYLIFLFVFRDLLQSDGEEENSNNNHQNRCYPINRKSRRKNYGLHEIKRGKGVRQKRRTENCECLAFFTFFAGA